MTMIIAATTDQCMVMASDRRISIPHGRGFKPHSDMENKCVILANQAVLGYTGPAELEGNRTDHWVVEVLSSAPVEDYFKILIERAARAVRSIRSDQRRLAFLIMVWAFDTRKQVLHPELRLISNFHDPGGRMRRNASDRFTHDVIRTPPGTARLFAVPGWLTQEKAMKLERIVLRYSRVHPGRPQGLLQVLGNSILDVANRLYGQSVGKELMLVSFPRSAYNQGFSVSVTEPSWGDRITAIYYGKDQGIVAFGPAFVSPWVSFGGIQATNDPVNAPLPPMRMPRRSASK